MACRFPLLILALLAFLATPSHASHSPRDTITEERIDRVINSLRPRGTLRNAVPIDAPLAERMAFYKTPGVSIAVVDDYKIAWAHGFGVRQYGRRDPVTETTLFQAASISKPIFALAVMRAVQEGELSLDTDINQLLKSWKVPRNGPWQPTITLRQILTHSAGLTVHGFPGYMASEKVPSLTEILDGVRGSKTRPVEVSILPGIHTRYSGGGFMIAQQAMIDRFGQPFPGWMHKTLFGPLGLRNSTFEQPLPRRLRSRAATAHPFSNRQVKGGWHTYPEMAPAGLWTTPSDLALIGLDLQLTLRGAGSGRFSSNTVAEILSPQIENMGIGFMLEGRGSSARFGHGGWNEGYLSEMRMCKHHGKGAVIMINSNEGGELITEILRAIAREYQWPDYNPKDDPKRVNPAAITPERLAQLAGKYEVRPGITFTLEPGGGRLLLQWLNQPPLEYFPSSPTNLFSTSINTELQIGSENEVTLLQDNQHFPAQRLP